MNELDKMRNGQPYNFSAPEIEQEFARARQILSRLNRLCIHSRNYRQLLETIIPGIPASAMISPPFFCDLGYRIRLQEEVFINVNCTLLDTGGISIGARTKIGPNCQLYTPQHPLDYRERRRPVETGHPIVVGEDCWLGGGVIVCPGVTIGNRCIVAAGSVVTGDIPDDYLAAGNPAAIKRKLL